jgi:hypothetical protein
MSIESDSTAYYYHYNLKGKRVWAITTDLEEAQEDPEYRIATKNELNQWFDATGESFNEIIKCQDGLFLWVEDEDNCLYTYMNVEELQLEVTQNKKGLAIA